MRDTITVKGAKENNLKNIDVEIPRDKLIVLTGLSGSGKSSLAFETIYAEGQRRFLESLSTYARKYVAQLKKPDVDYIQGLSPVISIEQKSVSKNPRSTVGTMTDIYDYFRVLYTASGIVRCPYCRQEAPVFKLYGEDFPYLFGEIRSKGYRRMRIDDELVDLSEEFELDEALARARALLSTKFCIRSCILSSTTAVCSPAPMPASKALNTCATSSISIRHRLAVHPLPTRRSTVVSMIRSGSYSPACQKARRAVIRQGALASMPKMGAVKSARDVA